MQPVTVELQKLIELSSMVGAVNTVAVLGLIVNIIFQHFRAKKKNDGNPNAITVMLLQQQSETLKSLTANLTTMVALGGQQANILAGIANGIQEIKLDTSNLPAMGKQLQEIDRCLAVVKDRLEKGG
jgi:hypothetical protein